MSTRPPLVASPALVAIVRRQLAVRPWLNVEAGSYD